MIFKEFSKLNLIIRIILLVIPAVNWIVEIVVRWSYFLKKQDVLSLVMALIATFGGGIILGYVDAVWSALNNSLFLTD